MLELDLLCIFFVLETYGQILLGAKLFNNLIYRQYSLLGQGLVKLGKYLVHHIII